jgi:hypothetical protein
MAAVRKLLVGGDEVKFTSPQAIAQKYRTNMQQQPVGWCSDGALSSNTEICSEKLR